MPLKPRNTLLLAVAAILAAALALAACGEKSEHLNGQPQPFSLTLDFYPNPDHVGIYEAQKLGYFRDAGLDVSINSPTDPAAPIKEVAAGRADLAISYEPELLLAREQSLDVKAVGALVDSPLTSLIWLRKAGIKRLGDLRGKTIATAGIPYQNAFLETILARVNMKPSDVKSVNVGLNLLPAILGGRAQAMLGGFSNVEGIDLKLRHKDPTVTPVDQLGIPTYDELVFVAQASRLKDDSEPIRLFLAAMARGTAAAEKDPKGATQALLEQNHNLDPKLTAAEVKATLPVLSQASPKRPYGYMNQAEWQQFIGWMRDHGLISSLPTPPQVLTEELLPGSIPG
ncbi:MAG TPA: ABC transporter substrate-binding protein [Solirubrobacterales bacterium]